MDALEFRKIISKINKNAFEKLRFCLYPNCNNHSINSHLLQRNGILNNISENKHVYQFRANHQINVVPKKQAGFELISDKKAMTFLGFCSLHDNDIFKHIEDGTYNFSDYKSKILFTYRAFCNEYRKKEIVIDFYQRCLKSNTIDEYIDKEYFQAILKNTINGFSDLKKYVDYCYDELVNPNENFVFIEYEFEKFPFCASSVFSPVEFNELNETKTLMNVLAVHVIPLPNKLKIIFGYHKNHFDNWILDYINSYSNIERPQLLAKLSDLITSRIETWAISQTVYKSISKKNIELHDEFFRDNVAEFSRNLKSSFNLFENS